MKNKNTKTDKDKKEWTNNTTNFVVKELAKRGIETTVEYDKNGSSIEFEDTPENIRSINELLESL